MATVTVVVLPPPSALLHPSITRSHTLLRTSSPLWSLQARISARWLSPPVIFLKSLTGCPFMGERKELDGRKSEAYKLGIFMK